LTNAIRCLEKLGQRLRKDKAMPDAAPPALNPIRVLVLTNTRQANRFTYYSPNEDPDPWREYRLLGEHGMNLVLRDRTPLPWNPLARRHVFYAGLDPWRALRILCFDRRVDLVLCVFENTAFFLVLLRRLFRFRPPIAILEISPRGWRPRDLVLDWVMPRADLVIALTRAQARYVETTWTLRHPPEVLDWVVDESYYEPRPTPEGGGYVLSVGEDISRDFSTLVAACAALDCELVIKTRKPVEIPPGMHARVRIIGERLLYTAFRDLYAGAQVVAIPMVPTDNPGGISSLLEAMAMGRPVVASETNTSRELMIDGETGLLVPPRDPAALRAALQTLLQDAALAARLGAAARRRIEQRYGMAARQPSFAAMLRRFCGAPPWPAAAPSLPQSS
jgi:glycosyltransferase involved in cell wall biosynthesis